MVKQMTIDETLLQRCGVTLPDPVDRKTLIRILREEYRKRVSDVLCRGLTLEQRAQLTKRINSDPDGFTRWLEEIIPDYQERLARTGDELEEEIRTQRRRIMQVLGGAELELPLEKLKIGCRIYNCLKRAGIHTVEDILSRSRQEIMALRNFPYKKISLLDEGIYRAIVPENGLADE